MSDERTVAPSRRKIELARSLGRVAQSRDLTAAASLGATSAAWSLGIQPLIAAMVSNLRRPISEPSAPLAPEVGVLVERLETSLLALGVPLLGLLLLGTVVAILVQQLQVGGLFVPALAIPDPRRLGIGRESRDHDGPSFLATRLPALVGQGARLVLVLGVVGVTVASRWPLLMIQLELGWPECLEGVGDFARVTIQRLAVLLLAMGVVDLLLARRRWLSELQSSPEEHRQEQRALEGDPALRSRRRRVSSERGGRGVAKSLGSSRVANIGAGEEL